MGTVKLSDVCAGDAIHLDDGFTCAVDGEVIVQIDGDGDLYFACEEGEHYLKGQLDDDLDTLVGVIGHKRQSTVTR